MNPNHAGWWIAGAVVVSCLLLWVVITLIRLKEAYDSEPLALDDDDGIEEAVAQLTYTISVVGADKAAEEVAKFAERFAQLGKVVSARVSDGVVVVSLSDLDEDDDLSYLDHGSAEVGGRTLPEILRAAGLDPALGVGSEKWMYAPSAHDTPDVEVVTEEERANHATHETRTGLSMDDGGFEMCVLCGWQGEALYDSKCPGPTRAEVDQSRRVETFDPRD